MARENTNTDEDFYALGSFSTGNVVELDLRLPSTSTVAARLRLLDDAGNVIADEDGDLQDDHFLATLSQDGAYFAEVTSYVVHNGSRYLLTTGQPWTDAEALAQSLGGHLVTVGDQAEQDFLQQTFGSWNLWIGLNDFDNEGTHVWSSGEAVTYTNWGSGEPNTPSWNAVYKATDGLWYDNPTTSNFQALVELPDPGGRLSAGPGSFAQYLLDINVADLVPPQVVDIDRIPDEGGSTDEVIATFEVTVSEALIPSTVNNPVYEEFDTHNGHTYVQTPSTMTWQQAEDFAQSLGGNLVTITDQAEQDFLQQTFGSSNLWIGLNDIDNEGTHVWSSGEAVTYTNWGSGEPNTPSYNGVYLGTDGLWRTTRHRRVSWRSWRLRRPQVMPTRMAFPTRSIRILWIRSTAGTCAKQVPTASSIRPTMCSTTHEFLQSTPAVVRSPCW